MFIWLFVFFVGLCTQRAHEHNIIFSLRARQYKILWARQYKNLVSAVLLSWWKTVSEISFRCALVSTKDDVPWRQTASKSFYAMRWRVQDVMFPWTHTVSKTFHATLQRVQDWSLTVVPFRVQAGNALQEVWVCVRANEKGRERGKSLGDKLRFCNSGEECWSFCIAIKHRFVCETPHATVLCVMIL